MQIGRLFEIVYLLLNKKKTTAKELAERFEVSVRTIYRDIDALCEAGIPIYATRGTGGGIFLQEDFVLNKSLLSEEEQSRILVALQSMAATRHLESDQLMSRLGHLFRKDEADWIEVDFTGWGSDEKEKEDFRKLRDAVIGGRSITFDYAGTGGRFSQRTVSPRKLIYKSRAWYLQAYCHHRQANRLFKLSRMLQVGEPGQPFDREALPPPEEIDTGYPPALPQTPIVLRFSSGAVYRLYDEFPRQDIAPQEDGSYLLVLRLPEDDWLYGMVLSYGADVEVLSPPHVRERLRKIIDDMQKQYII